MSGSALPPRAVFYVSDMGFALPTLVSAMAVRRWVRPETADIRIVAIDFPYDALESVRRFLEPHSIYVDVMDSAIYSQFDLTKFNKTHVPRSTLGRFFMLQCAPRAYEHVTYLDGDTWILRDPSELITWRPPPGMLAAAEDPSYFCRNDLTPHGFRTRAYFKGLGLLGNHGYFNAGVLAADTDTWREISMAAFDFFVRHPDRCLYHDQSALNAVARERRVRLSPKWNFTSFYRNLEVEESVAPAIYHFTGHAKPWRAASGPWADINCAYLNALDELSELGLSIGHATPAADAVNAHRRFLRQFRMLDTLFKIRKLNRARDVNHILNTSVKISS